MDEKDRSTAETFIESTVGRPKVSDVQMLIENIRQDEREECAKAIERDGAEAFANGGPTLNESLMYDICAATVRQRGKKAPCDG